MPSYGLLPEGFVPKTLEILKQEYEEAFQASFGAGVNLEPESNNGQLIAIMAERDAELWDALSDIYSSWDPDQATGVALDSVAGITGTIREAASESTTTALAVGTTGTVLPVGRIFSVEGAGTRFVTTEGATLAAVTAWAISTAYAVGAIRKNGGNVYYCITPGTSAGSGGPTGTGTDITDGGVHWRYVGAGTGYALVPVEAEETGPKPANAWTLTVVETAVAGLSAVTNPTDALLGNNVETDAVERLRREDELQATGNAALDAIRANLLALDGVTSVSVFENDDPAVTNGDGMPPNSVEAVVRGGDTEEIRAAVFASKAAGIKAVGGNSGTVEDTEGTVHTVAFTRPTEILLYLDVVLTTDDNFPTDGIAQVKTALSTWGAANLETGEDVIQSQLFAPIFAIPGIVDVSKIAIGTSAWPASEANFAINSRSLAVLDTARVRVNGV